MRELMSIILPIAVILIAVFIIFCIIYAFRRLQTSQRINDRFKQLCNEFGEMGMTVKVYRGSYKEEDFWLVKILKEEELIREKEFSVSDIKREFNLLLTRNEEMEKLLEELT